MLECVDPKKLTQNEIEDRILQLESRLERIYRFKNAENQKQKAQKRHFHGKKFRSKSTEINNKNINSNSYLLKSNDCVNPQNLVKNSQKMFFSRSRPNLWRANRMRGDSSVVSPLYSYDEEKSNVRPNLFLQMETSQYFWDTSPRPTQTNFENNIVEKQRLENYFLPLNNQIPVSNAVLLQSDIPGMNRKLDEIRQNLRSLKEFGLNSSSKNYFRINMSNQSIGQEIKQAAGTPNLSYIRARICNIEFYMEERIRKILDSYNISGYQRLNSLNDNDMEKTVADSNTISKEQTILMPNTTFENSQVKNELNNNIQRNNFAMTDNKTAKSSEKNQNNVLTEYADKKILFTESHALKTENNNNFKDIEKNGFQVEPRPTNPVNIAIDGNQNKTTNLNFEAAGINNTHNSENYERMLQMLKRPEYQISTSSSSDENEYYNPKIVKNSKLDDPLKNTILSQQQQPIPQSTQLNITTTIKQPLSNITSKFKTALDKDSDSDFFN